MIALTEAQANLVRGLTVMGHALAPVPLVDGTFVLPENCATDAAHLVRRTSLQGRPTRAVLTTEYLYNKAVPTAQEIALLAACEFKSTWLPGQLVTVTR